MPSPMFRPNPNLIDVLAIRRRLGRGEWSPPREVWPESQTWAFDELRGDRRILVTGSDFPPEIDPSGREWIHASISRPDSIPTYDDLVLLHRTVFDGGWAYQVFAPTPLHVNLNDTVLHLFGLVGGAPALPNFGALGSI